jgi:hypothetical protein
MRLRISTISTRRPAASRWLDDRLPHQLRATYKRGAELRRGSVGFEVVRATVWPTSTNVLKARSNRAWSLSRRSGQLFSWIRSASIDRFQSRGRQMEWGGIGPAGQRRRMAAVVFELDALNGGR